jgi:hypothetical protein
MTGIIGKSAPVARPTRREPSKVSTFIVAANDYGSSSHTGSILLTRANTHKQPEKCSVLYMEMGRQFLACGDRPMKGLGLDASKPRGSTSI